MFNGLFQFNVYMAAVAGISIILAAVYTLNMVQKIIYGEVNAVTANAVDLAFNVKLVLVIIALVIIVFGVFPQPLIDLTKDSAAGLFLKK